jgi:hypothetical protein
VEELRGKSTLGGYADFTAYLAEWYRETVEQLYALMLGWVEYDAIQALTQKYCMHGARRTQRTSPSSSRSGMNA